MRYRLLASYRGAPYEAGVGPTDADVVLFAACPPPEELGFEPATGHWRKHVRLAEVQTLHESRPAGVFRGERCVVLDDLGDRLHIMYLGHDAYRAEQIGYWEVDRGVFELIAPRHEVTELVEQRLAFPGHASGWPPEPGHQAPGQASVQPLEPAGFPTGTGYPADPPYAGSTGHQAHTSYQPAAANGAVSGPHHVTSVADGHAGPAAQADSVMAGPDDPLAEFYPAGPTGYDQPGHDQPGHDQPEYDQPEYDQPEYDQPPLPLEAEALRAATAALRRDQAHHTAQADRSGQPVQAQAAMPPAAPVQAPPAPAEAPVSPRQSPAIDVPAERVQARSAPQPEAAAPCPPAAGSGPAAPQDQAPAEPGTPAAASVAAQDQPVQPAAPASGELAPAGLAAPPSALMAAPPAPVAVPPAPVTAPRATAPAQASAAVTQPLRTAVVGEPQQRPRQVERPDQAPVAADGPDAVQVHEHGAATGHALTQLSQPQESHQPPGANGNRAGPSVQPPGSDQQAAQPSDPAPARSAPAAESAAPHPRLVPQPEPVLQPVPAAQPEPLLQPVPAPQPEPAPPPVPAVAEPEPASAAAAQPVNQAEPDAPVSAAPRRRRAAKPRLPTQRIFSDLASQAAIPASAYAVGEDVDGAMCLVNTGEGFEVFNSAAGARHEVRVFTDEESAYFYLFGVLVADAVRTGALVPKPQ